MTDKSKVYICMWDENGFEVLKDCSSWERQCLLDTLAGKKLKAAPVNLNAMIMRARFNPQRNYEIWSFNTAEDLDEDRMWRYAENNPQALVDLIRVNGKKIYENTKNTEAKIR